jgi:hypothetical protein
LNYNGYFFWFPLYAPQAKADGSVQGNPHVDVRKVIALARASADPAIQKKFDETNVGPMIDPSLAPADDKDNADESVKPTQENEASGTPKADGTPEKAETPEKAATPEEAATPATGTM